jgi:hypothetical protein
MQSCQDLWQHLRIVNWKFATTLKTYQVHLTERCLYKKKIVNFTLKAERLTDRRLTNALGSIQTLND